MVSGFILTSNIKTSNNKSYLEISGRLSDGRSFLWLNSKPYLCGFLPQEENDTSSTNLPKKKKNFKSFGGEIFNLVHFSNLPAFREELNNTQNKLVEGDVEISHRFLMEKKIRGSVQFISEGRENEQGIVIFIDPKVKPSRENIPLKVLSFDIEIGVKSNDFLDAEQNPLYSIAYTDGQVDKVLMIAKEIKQDGYIEYFTDEQTLLKAFIREMQILNPQVFIGWNVLNFDFQFLIKKCELYQISFDLGVNNTPIDYFLGKATNDLYVRMSGRVVLDGIPMLRSMGVKLPNYKLDTAAKVLLDEGKTIVSTGSDKVKEIENYFLNDKKRLAEYNLVDTKLVFDIYQKLDIVQFQQLKVKWSGVLFDRLTSESDVFDFLYLPPLHSQNYVSPKPSKKLTLKSPTPGIINNHYFQFTFCIDFPQINAHAIMLYKIDPLGRTLAEQDQENAIISPSGLPFHRSQTILPKLLTHYFYLKEKYARHPTYVLAMDNLINIVTSAVTKETCRFYSPALINAITSASQAIKEYVKNILKDGGYKIVHEENERLYISNNLVTNDKDINELIEIAKSHLKKKLREDIAGDDDEINQIIPIIPGPIYEYFFITNTGAGSALKTVYLGKTGSEWHKSDNLLRGDVALLYSQFEKDLFSSIFRQQNPLDVIKDYLQKINNGEYNQQLLYRKRLFKNVKEYEEPYPIHIQAAKKIPGDKGKWVEYAVTTNGGEPKGYIVSPIDYQHYIDKLLKPLSKIALQKTAYEDALENIFSTKPQMSLFN